MTTSERRLEAVTGGLTAKERAVLFVRPPLRDEGESDERIRRLCPPDQTAEFERLVDVITRANYDLSRLLDTWCESLSTTISEVAWLESLHAALRARRCSGRPLPKRAWTSAPRASPGAAGEA